MPTVWDVQQPSAQLREGRLRLRVRNEQAVLLELTTDEIVVHESRQRFRFLLPAVFTTPTPELAVDVTWLDRRGETIALGEQILRVPFFTSEAVMLLVAEELSGRARPAEADRRLEALKIENNSPPTAERPNPTQPQAPPTSYQWAKTRLQTAVVSFPPQEFPTEPLAYTAYDGVLVTQSAFRRLRRDQLDALAAWITAGGRLLVEPEGLVEPHHVAFLNRLCAGDSRGLIWQMDERGRLSWPLQVDMEPLHVATEYGRVVLQPLEDRPAKFTTTVLEEQRQAARWFWSIRPPIHPDSSAPGLQVKPPVPTTFFTPAMGGRARRNARSSVVNVNDFGKEKLTQLIERVLAPTGVKLVPFWLVALLLAGLVLAIGPGEWILLGRLRRRSWTWFTWPALTLAATGALVGIANAYLRSNDLPRTLSIHDLDANGRIVRTNRFELLYPSRAGKHITTIRRGLFVDQQAAVQAPVVRNVTSTRTILRRSGATTYTVQVPTLQTVPDSQPLTPPPRMSGRLPGSYTVEQDVKQWTPRLNRVLSVPLEPPGGPIDWKQIDLEKWLTPTARGHAPPAVIVKEVRRQLGAKALVAVHHASGDWAVNDDRQWWSSDQAYHFARAAQVQPGTTTYTRDMHGWAKLVWLATHRSDAMATWTMWGPPLAQPLLGDLPILEPGGPHEWAVSVVVRQRDDVTVYRRAFAAVVVDTVVVAGAPDPAAGATAGLLQNKARDLRSGEWHGQETVPQREPSTGAAEEKPQ